MNKYTKEEQKLIDAFDRGNAIPSKKFEKNLDKAMQDILLTPKRGFFASFSFYTASIVAIVLTSVLSASFLYIYTNSSQQSGNNIRILSDSEKTIAIQNIQKNNLSFLKVPQQIEEKMNSEENTKIAKTKISFEQTPYTPVCSNTKQVTEYNIYTYTEAGSVYVKEEIKTPTELFEKVSKDLDNPVYFYNGNKTSDVEVSELFESDQFDYELSEDSLVLNNLKQYVYRLKGEYICVPTFGNMTDLTPVSYTLNGESKEAYIIPFERDIFIDEDSYKITSEIIRQLDGSQVYVSKLVTNTELEATITNLKTVFRIE